MSLSCLNRLLGVFLILGAMSPSHAQNVPIGGSAPELQPKAVGRETLKLEAKSVVQTSLVRPEGTHGVTGIHLYSFTLEPKERLNVQMKSEQSALVMAFLEPTKVHPMSRAVKAANLPPYAARMTRIRIQNSTDSPQEVILQVGGPVNHAYTLSLGYEKR